MPTSQSQSHRQAVHIEQICAAYEQAWKDGQRPSLEGVLQAHHDLDSSALISQLLKIELFYRRQLGETPQPDEYLRRLAASEEVILAVFNDTVQDVAQASTPDSKEQQHVPDSEIRTGAYMPDSAVRTGAYVPETGQASIPVPGVPPGYEVLEVISSGGQGCVYKARHLGLNRIVALKVILSGVAATSDQRERFRREAHSIALLQHPNVIEVFDYGESQGQPFMAMEYCSGGSLAARVKRQRPSPKEAARMVEAVAKGVQAAHQVRVIHRDLKPGNVLLTAEGQFKVTDFGLAKQLDADLESTPAEAILGTPGYMAPEQVWANDSIGPTTDVYGLGAVLYQLLTGHAPFTGDNKIDVVMKALHELVVSPRAENPTVPSDLETICLKCLEKDPEKRYRSAEALAAELRRFQEDRPILARPIGPLEQAWRWAKRNPTVAGLSALAFVLMLTTITILAVAAYRINAARGEEQQARIQADEAFDLTLDAVRGIVLITDREMRGKAVYAPIRQRVLNQATRDLEKIRSLVEDHPLVDRTKASIYTRLADICKRANRIRDAARLYDQAATLLQSEIEEKPNDSASMSNLGRIKKLQGDMQMRLGDGEASRNLYAESLDLRRKWVSLSPNDLNAQQAVANTLGLLGDACLMLGEPGPALAAYEQAEQAYNALKLPADQMWGYFDTRIKIVFRMGDCLCKLGRLKEAYEKYRAAQVICLRRLKTEPNRLALKLYMADAYTAAGTFQLLFKHNPMLAWKAFQRARATYAEWLKSDQLNLIAQRELAMRHYKLGVTAERLIGVAITAGPVPFALAQVHMATCLRLREPLAQVDDQDTRSQIDFMLILARVGRVDEAEALAKALQKDHADDRRILFQTACSLAIASDTSTDPARAQHLEEAALNTLGNLVEAGWKDRAVLETDPDLDAIQRHPQFRQLVEGIEPTAISKAD